MPGRPDVHNSIASPPYCGSDDTITSIITAVWLIIGATILNRPSWLLILMRSRTRGSFPFHVLWDVPPPSSPSSSGKGVSQPQRVLVQPRVAHVLCCSLVQVVIQHRRCRVKAAQVNNDRNTERHIRSDFKKKNQFIAHMFSGKQREPEDRLSKQNGLNQTTGGSRRRKYTQIKTRQVL